MIVRGILGNTVGRVGSFAKRRLLGKLPENAIQGSFQEEKPKEDATLLAAQFAVIGLLGCLGVRAGGPRGERRAPREGPLAKAAPRASLVADPSQKVHGRRCTPD